MDLQDLKNKIIREELGFSLEFGRIFSFIDFANVNNWFSEDRQDWLNNALEINENIDIDIEKLSQFSQIFSQRARVYYGENPTNIKSKKFTDVLRIFFENKNVVTKELQKIKHYVEIDSSQEKPKFLESDKNGKTFVEIRKCNFDVEIAVDACKMIKHYDTFCLFSGDADFVYLNNFLRKKGKRIILIKGGHITSKLRESADLVINAQLIKKYIARIIKQKPD